MSPQQPKRTSSMPDSLRQKMAKATAGPSPLLPPGIGGKPLPEEKHKPKQSKEDKPELESFIKHVPTRAHLRGLIIQQEALNTQIKDLETQLAPIEEDIKTELNSYGITGSFIAGHCSVSFSPRARTFVDTQLLLAEGVTQEVIQRCTRTTYSTPLIITRQKS